MCNARPLQNDDYEDDKYSPVVQLQTMRVILAVASQLNLELVFLDLPKAFLMGRMDLTKPLYMFAPEGYGKPGETWVLRLPIYGLTMSSRRFFETPSEFMRAVGHEHFPGHDNCLFRRIRTLPTAKEANKLGKEAGEIGLKPRPHCSEEDTHRPMGPATHKPVLGRDGTQIRPVFECPYPEEMDLPEFQDPDRGFRTPCSKRAWPRRGV